MMDQQLIKLFTANNLEFIGNYFDDAKVIKAEYSTSEGFFRVVIEINDFLPLEVLLKLEQTLLENETLPTKISLRVRKEQYELETIFSYLEYIRLNKSELKNSFFSKLSPERFALTDNILKITVHSESEQKLVGEHCNYYQKKLRRYGFSDLQLALVIDLLENNILEINEQELIKYQETAQKTEQLISKPTNGTNPVRRELNSYQRAKNGEASYERLIDIDQDASNVTIYGKILSKERQLISTKKFIYVITITDYSDTIGAKFFTRTEQPDDFIEELKTNE